MPLSARLRDELTAERFGPCSFTRKTRTPAAPGATDYGDTEADRARRREILAAALADAPPRPGRRPALAPVIPLRRRKAS